MLGRQTQLVAVVGYPPIENLETDVEVLTNLLIHSPEQLQWIGFRLDLHTGSTQLFAIGHLS